MNANGNGNNIKIFNFQFSIFNQFSNPNFQTVFLIAIDQISKFVAVNYGLEIVKNRGVAFSILNEINPIFIAIILIILIKNFSKNLWFTLIIAGGIANLIDRIRLGHVVDFIDLGFWPVFNFADVFITLGVLGILYGYLRRQ